MLMQNLGGQTKSIMVFSELAYCLVLCAERMRSAILHFIIFIFIFLSPQENRLFQGRSMYESKHE